MYQKARFSGAAPTRKHPGARRDSLRLTASRRGPAHRTPPPLAGRPCPCSPSRPSLQSHCVHYLFLHLNTKRFSTGTTQEGLPAGRETHPFTPAFTPAAAPTGTPAHQGGSRAQPRPCVDSCTCQTRTGPQEGHRGHDPSPPHDPRTAQVEPVRAEGWVWGAAGPDPESLQKTASWTGREGQNDLAIPRSGLQRAGEALAAGGGQRPLSSCTGRARPRSR